MQVRRALLSVSDKRGIVEFARGRAELGIELVSTGGTARELTAAGLHVRAIDDLTGWPEMMDGRVKTLNAKLYAGVLALRDDPEHLRAAAEHDFEFVDLVCVNLYPFEATLARPAVLVFVSESHGLSEAVRSLNARVISIPRMGSAESLNVAMAAAALCTEFARQALTHPG